jgi:hypothetical protein
MLVRRDLTACAPGRGEAGGMSSGAAAACGEVSSPFHWLDREWRSLARTDPARRGKPGCVQENVRLAMPVGDLQGDVFFQGRTFNRFPTIIVRRRPHSPFPSSERPVSVCAATTSRLLAGPRLILRDWRHRLPKMIDEPENLAVIAKRVKVAWIGSDLNNGPCHAISLAKSR